jgi:hypothetical protein
MNADAESTWGAFQGSFLPPVAATDDGEFHFALERKREKSLAASQTCEMPTHNLKFKFASPAGDYFLLIFLKVL